MAGYKKENLPVQSGGRPEKLIVDPALLDQITTRDLRRDFMNECEAKLAMNIQLKENDGALYNYLKSLLIPADTSKNS